MSVLLTGCGPLKQFMPVTETVTFYPAAYDASNYSYASISNATNPVGKGSDNTTYATINLKTGSQAETYVFFPFDLSSIPENAVIDSVECKAKGYISSTSSSYVNTRQMQLFAGSTAKGSAATLTTSATAQTLTCGEWTRQELANCRLRMYAKRGTSSTSTSRNMRFYGAELTVTYTYVPSGGGSSGEELIATSIPILSSNGTVGGSAFAVSANNENSAPYAAYKAFDGLDSTGYSSGRNPSTSPISFVMYFPVAVFLESISIKNMGSGFTSSSPKDVVLAGSNDGQNWETISTISNADNTNGSSWTIPGTMKKAYSYFRLYITSCNTTNPYVNMGEITLNAFTKG